jgi:hypothetical protein
VPLDEDSGSVNSFAGGGGLHKTNRREHAIAPSRRRCRVPRAVRTAAWPVSLQAVLV